MTYRLSGRLARRIAGAATLAIVLFGTAACTDFLVAENPGAIEADDLNTEAYLGLLANGPIFGFQVAHDDVAYWNGQMSDELMNRNAANPFVEEGQIDRRELHSDMSYINAFLYAPLQRARFLGEEAARRMAEVLEDSASRDLRIARSMAYAGYSYVYLGEMFCEVPIDMGAPKPPNEIFADAIDRFDSAITIATAARNYQLGLPTPSAPIVAGADSIINFSRVGSARAALNRNDGATATGFASQVPDDFIFYAYYSNNSAVEQNRTWNRLTAGSNASMDNTPFEAKVGDPRLPRIADGTVRDGIPLSPPSYSTFNNTLEGAPFAPDVWVRIASGLEARYIIAEAAGPVPATMDFVNERRAAGLQGPIALAGDALMEELREQRSRDFYLDNHRLGDLRRYKAHYGVNLFPTGAYPGSTTGQTYNDAVDCWPLPRNELNDNPNIP